MTIQTDVLKLLKNVLPNHGFTQCNLDVSCGTLREYEAVDQKIKIFGGTGWIARQSGAVRCERGDEDDPGLGAVVSAELASGKKSLQIRRAQDGWLCTELTETESPSQETEGKSYLRDSVQQVALENRVANYCRYWSCPEDGAAEIVAWRLVGLTPLEEDA